MKYLAVITAFVLMSFIPETTWKLDTAHSNFNFSVGHLQVSEITGSFNFKESTIVCQGDDFSDAVVSVEIDMTTVDTDNAKRDEHLKSADFFEVAKYPSGKFKSKSCKKTDGQNYMLTGDLEMHGITKPATFNMSVKTGVNPNNKKAMAGIKVTGSIKRSDYGISPSAPEEILTDVVTLVANLEYMKE